MRSINKYLFTIRFWLINLNFWLVRNHLLVLHAHNYFINCFDLFEQCSPFLLHFVISFNHPGRIHGEGFITDIGTATARVARSAKMFFRVFFKINISVSSIHQIEQFEVRNSKNFLGRGSPSPLPRPLPPLLLGLRSRFGLRPQISGGSRPRFGFHPIRTPPTFEAWLRPWTSLSIQHKLKHPLGSKKTPLVVPGLIHCMKSECMMACRSACRFGRSSVFKRCMRADVQAMHNIFVHAISLKIGILEYSISAYEINSYS